MRRARAPARSGATSSSSAASSAGADATRRAAMTPRSAGRGAAAAAPCAGFRCPRLASPPRAAEHGSAGAQQRAQRPRSGQRGSNMASTQPELRDGRRVVNSRNRPNRHLLKPGRGPRRAAAGPRALERAACVRCSVRACALSGLAPLRCAGQAQRSATQPQRGPDTAWRQESAENDSRDSARAYDDRADKTEQDGARASMRGDCSRSLRHAHRRRRARLRLGRRPVLRAAQARAAVTHRISSRRRRRSLGSSLGRRAARHLGGVRLRV
jgi:hypothetical protein